MILREFIKRSIAFLLLSVFLLSTSGMVMYYHFCKYSNEMIVSVFVDSTSEDCLESSSTHVHNESSTEDFCCSEHAIDDCCNNHQTASKTAKLNVRFAFSEEHLILTPSIFTLPFSTPQLELEFDKLNTQNLSQYNIREYKPISAFGRQLITQLHSFKVYC